MATPLTLLDLPDDALRMILGRPELVELHDTGVLPPAWFCAARTCRRLRDVAYAACGHLIIS